MLVLVFSNTVGFWVSRWFIMVSKMQLFVKLLKTTVLNNCSR